MIEHLFGHMTKSGIAESSGRLIPKFFWETAILLTYLDVLDTLFLEILLNFKGFDTALGSFACVISLLMSFKARPNLLCLWNVPSI